MKILNGKDDTHLIHPKTASNEYITRKYSRMHSIHKSCDLPDYKPLTV